MVMHELQAPVPRAEVVRGPAIKQLRFMAFSGAVVGAIVGELAARGCPGTSRPGRICSAVAFALAGMLGLGDGHGRLGSSAPLVARQRHRGGGHRLVGARRPRRST